MTLVILCTMPRGGSSGSMSLFFAALAVSDLALLYTGLLRQWLYRTVTLDLRVLHDVICKIHVLVVLVPGGDDDAAGGVVAVAASGLLSTRRKAQVRMTHEVFTSSETVSSICASRDLNKRQNGEHLCATFDHKEIILVNSINCIVSNCFVTFLKTIRTQTFG